MKAKTSVLIDAALDWAVGYARCLTATNGKPILARDLMDAAVRNGMSSPSTDWAQGGPIIELNEIGSFHYIHGFHGPTWSASIGSGGFQQDGPTLLIAAMRCYCCAKLGDEIEIPQELQPCQQLKT